MCAEERQRGISADEKWGLFTRFPVGKHVLFCEAILVAAGQKRLSNLIPSAVALVRGKKLHVLSMTSYQATEKAILAKNIYITHMHFLKLLHAIMDIVILDLYNKCSSSSTLYHYRHHDAHISCMRKNVVCVCVLLIQQLNAKISPHNSFIFSMVHVLFK